MMKKFIRQNIDHQPIVDNVFKIVSLANDAIALGNEKIALKKEKKILSMRQLVHYMMKMEI